MIQFFLLAGSASINFSVDGNLFFVKRFCQCLNIFRYIWQEMATVSQESFIIQK